MHAVCPKSGVCVTLPRMCSEGDPFANKNSLYYQDAMAAQVLLVEQQERKAALHQAAVKHAASLHSAAVSTPQKTEPKAHAQAHVEQHFG